MKKLVIGLMAVVMVGTALAVDQAELERRVRMLTAKFNDLQSQPNKGIPAEVLRTAQGIILLDRTKAGFLFAFQGGGGVALARDSKTQAWSPAAFVSANEASLGFQIGGEQNFFVILLMDTNSTRLLTEPRFEMKSEVRSTAGEDSAGLEGRITKPKPPVLVYDDRKGLFAGADVKAGAITPDDEANRVYYAAAVTMRDILFDKKVKPTEPTKELIATITEHSKATKR